MVRHLCKTDRVLGAAVVALLLYMCGWVFLWPASYLAGWWPAHDAALARLIAHPGMATPHDVLSKYAPHTAVKLTHHLPSGVWSLCGALQLIPRLRATAPRLHRAAGRLMLLCAVAIVVGYALIEARGLVTEPLPSPSRSSFSSSAFSSYSDGDEGGGGGGGGGDVAAGAEAAANPHPPALRLLCAWFLLTAGAALAHARAGRLKAHRRWALRHVASGAWVIVQRLIIGGVMAWSSASGAAAFSEAHRRELFFRAASTAVVICVVVSELYLWLREGHDGPPAAAAAAAAAARPPLRAPPRGKADEKTD